MKLIITAISILFTASLIGQCKGFELKKDEFKGIDEMRTLWIANSTKLKGNKLQYRIEKSGDTTLLMIKTVLARKISVPSSSEVFFVNENGDKMNFQIKEETETTEVQTLYGKGQELRATFYVPDDLLKTWNTSFNRARLYYNEESLTFEFNHNKNLKLFHEALNCYKREYAKIKFSKG